MAAQQRFHNFEITTTGPFLIVHKRFCLFRPSRNCNCWRMQSLPVKFASLMSSTRFWMRLPSHFPIWMDQLRYSLFRDWPVGATIAAYYGSYYDMIGAMFLSPRDCVDWPTEPANISRFLVWKKYWYPSWSDRVGNNTTRLEIHERRSRFVPHHTHPCIWVHCWLIHLPGAEIVWGVLKI